MLSTSNRIIFSDNGTLTDYTKQLNDRYDQDATIGMVSAEDYLYLGSDMPFNSRYIEVAVPNGSAAGIAVEIWTNDAGWVSAADVIDETKSPSTDTLGQSGYVTWLPPKDRAWLREDTNFEGESVTGLTDVEIYDLFWARLSVDANIDPTTSISYVGHKFADDTDLEVYYPELTNSNTFSAWSSTKANWTDQHLAAAQEVIADIKSMREIFSSNQILERKLFKLPAIHKCAQIIFRAFGDDFKDNYERATKEYKEALDIKYFRSDWNADGLLDSFELGHRQKRLVR